MNALVEKNLSGIREKLILVPEEHFERFKDIVLSWYEDTCESITQTQLPKVCLMDMLEKFADDIYPFMDDCVTVNLEQQPDNEFPMNLNEWTDDHWENKDEIYSSSCYRIENNFITDVGTLLDYLQMPYIDSFYLHRANREQWIVYNYPVCEVW